MPGVYDLQFRKAVWRFVKVDGGKTTTLKPAAVILAAGLKWKAGTDHDAGWHGGLPLRRGHLGGRRCRRRLHRRDRRQQVSVPRHRRRGVRGEAAVAEGTHDQPHPTSWEQRRRTEIRRCAKDTALAIVAAASFALFASGAFAQTPGNGGPSLAQRTVSGRRFCRIPDTGWSAKGPRCRTTGSRARQLPQGHLHCRREKGDDLFQRALAYARRDAILPNSLAIKPATS